MTSSKNRNSDKYLLITIVILFFSIINLIVLIIWEPEPGILVAVTANFLTLVVGNLLLVYSFIKIMPLFIARRTFPVILLIVTILINISALGLQRDKLSFNVYAKARLVDELNIPMDY